MTGFSHKTPQKNHRSLKSGASTGLFKLRSRPSRFVLPSSRAATAISHLLGELRRTASDRALTDIIYIVMTTSGLPCAMLSRSPAECGAHR
jgi:hypothetical protein